MVDSDLKFLVEMAERQRIDAELQKAHDELEARVAARTPTEIEVAKLIRLGKTTKEIAEITSTATSTIDFHRNNIRKKVGIISSSVNLRSYLSSLS